MVVIKYLNVDDYITARACKFPHIVRIYNTLENTHGFCIYKTDAKTLIGEFPAYTTVYNKTESYIEYSDDGSKYTPPEPTPTPDPSPNPTIEERLADLEDALCELAGGAD